MAEFDWQTEEDEAAWEALQQWPTNRSLERSPRGRWLALLAVLLLVGGTAAFFYVQVSQRVSEATAGVEGEVLASHHIVRFAAEQQDPEILTTFLSGRDPAWSQVQQDLAAAGVLFDRQSLGMHLLPAGPPERVASNDHRRVISVTLSPELTEATVTVAQAYTVAVGNGVTETIYLQQEGVYRKGDDRWLYSPREDDPIYTEEVGNYVVLRFDQREGEIVRRLAADLDRKVAELCNLPDTTCPPDLRVYVGLEYDPRLLVEIGDLNLRYGARLLEGERDASIVLPTPSLVGLPMDEAGYRALYRGYAAQILRVLLTWEVWPWNCCDHAPVFQALVEQQLAGLGVQAAPLGPADYRRLLQENFALLEDTMQSWYGRQFVAADSRAWLEGQAVVAFLQSREPRASLAAMAGKLNEAANFWFWTYEFLGSRISDTELTQEWLRFAFEEAGLTQTEPTGPWPAAEALLLCGSDYATNQHLYRYEPEGNALVEIVGDRGFLDLQPLPNGEGALLIEAEGGGNQREIRLSLWQDDELRLLWNSQETGVSLSYQWSALDAAGERLTMQVEGREGNTHILLDLAACLDGPCAAEVLPGMLLWSPDGAYSLIIQPDRLLLADGLGEIIRPVISGTFSAPFWLDNHTYGYLRRVEKVENGPMVGELVAVDANTRQEEVLVGVDELAALLPLGPEVYHLERVAPNPVAPNLLLLQVIDYTSSSSAADLFQLDRATGEVTHLFNAGAWSPPRLAPDGKWLALITFDRAARGSALYLYEFESGREMRLPQRQMGAFSWSPDGRWLLAAGGSLVHLVAPDEDYRQVLVHAGPPCGMVAWAR